MKPRTFIVLMVIFLGSTAQVSAKVSMAVSRREESVFVPLNYRETRVEMARIYNTGDAPLELTLTWTQTGGNLEGVLAPDSLVLEPNETRLCYLVFNASAMGGLSGVLEVRAVQDEIVLNQSGAGGSVVPAFEVPKSVTVAESPVLEVELAGASPGWSLAILNVGPEASDGLLSWQVQAPEWLRLSKYNGFGPANVEVALSPDVAPGTYEGFLLVESNVGSEQIPFTVIVEEPVEEPDEPDPQNTDPPESPLENTTNPLPKHNQEEPGEPEPEPESMNWTPVITVGLLATGVFTALRWKRTGGKDEEEAEEAENEVFTDLKKRTQPETAVSKLRRRMGENR